MYGQCTAGPTPTGPTAAAVLHLSAAPQALSFGNLTPGANRRLAVRIINDGEAVVTLRAHLEPADAAFFVEPMGSGPFWVRPGRDRAVFVRYAPTAAGPHAAALVIDSDAPPVRVPVSGD